jgi:hypothetical protein
VSLRARARARNNHSRCPHRSSGTRLPFSRNATAWVSLRINKSAEKVSDQGDCNWEGETVLSPQRVAFRSVETNVLLFHGRTRHTNTFAHETRKRSGTPISPSFRHPRLELELSNRGLSDCLKKCQKRFTEFLK